MLYHSFSTQTYRSPLTCPTLGWILHVSWSSPCLLASLHIPQPTHQQIQLVSQYIVNICPRSDYAHLLHCSHHSKLSLSPTEIRAQQSITRGPNMARHRSVRIKLCCSTAKFVHLLLSMAAFVLQRERQCDLQSLKYLLSGS